MVHSNDTVSSANCLPAGTLLGEYRLLRVVGEGGFGVVYQARDLSLDRIVAIKEYMPTTLAGRLASNQLHVRSQHRSAFDAGLRSFINEARLLAKFSHPTLVHVYRFFEANGTAYMVMRYYEGITFKRFLASYPDAVNERWLSALMVPVLDVLEMLHAADCFHRDISPDNIFLQTTGVPVLLDFGAARRIIGDLTQALTMVLKPGFAPIEQYVDDGAMPQGAWTDIYQLGAMLHLAVTGRQPATAVARMINDPMAPLTPASCPGYSARFLQGIQHALAVKPEDRPQSIAALREALGLVRGSAQQGTAPPPSPQTVSAAPVAPQDPGTTGLIQHGQGSGDSEPSTGTVSTPPADRPTAAPALLPTSMSPRLPPGLQSLWSRVGLALALVAAGWWLWPASEAPVASVTDGPPAVAAVEGPKTLVTPLPTRPIGQPAVLGATTTPPPAAALPASAPAVPAEPRASVRSTPSAMPTAAAVPVRPSSVPLPAAPKPLPATAPPAMAPAAPVQLAASEPESTQETGVVVFRVAPWANVTVNRVPRGTTPPLRELVLPEGQYRIEISNPAAAAQVRTVQVRKGESVVVQHTFE